MGIGEQTNAPSPVDGYNSKTTHGRDACSNGRSSTNHTYNDLWITGPGYLQITWPGDLWAIVALGDEVARPILLLSSK